MTRYVYATRANVPDYLVRFGENGAQTVYALVCDARGSVRLVVEVASGAVAQRLDYDEFGRVRADTSPGFQPFGFGGGLYDPATGLVHFGARDYDPQTGRWTAPDPAGFGGGLNLYGYCVADPVNLSDPAGLGPEVWDGFQNNWFYNGFNWWMDFMGGAGTSDEFWSPHAHDLALGFDARGNCIAGTNGVNVEMIGQVDSIGFIPIGFHPSPASGIYLTPGANIPLSAIGGSLTFNAGYTNTTGASWEGRFIGFSGGEGIVGGGFGDSNWRGVNFGIGGSIGFPANADVTWYKPLLTGNNFK